MIVEHIPCGEFANESERLAIEHFRKKLQSKSNKEKYILLSNLMFSFDSKGLSDEIDILVISPSSVIVIEVKHWDIPYITKNSEVADAEAERLNNKAKKVASLLKRYSIDAGFIEGRLLLTKPDSSILNHNPIRGIKLYSLKDWQALLNVDSAPVFDENQMKRICTALEPKTKIAVSGDIRRFAGITNLELISHPDNRFHRVYKGLHLLRKDKVILNIFDLSASEEKNALDAARREFDIIQKLQKSPYLPRIMDSFQEAIGYPGEIYFYSLVDPSAPTLEDIAKDESITYKERLNIAINCLKALDSLHNPDEEGMQGIIHRKINPSTIKIKNRAMPIFTQLTHAKLPDCTISPCLSSPDAFDEFTAPEVKSGGLSVADASSDIYSICKSLSLLFNVNNYADALNILKDGFSENKEERKSLNDLIEGLKKILSSVSDDFKEEKPLPVHLWDEDTEICFNNHYYKIISKLGSGGIGITFKVVQINKHDKSELGTYVAKVIHDEENARNAINAYNKVRSYTTHPHLAMIYETTAEWQRDNFVALMKWIEGMSLSDLTGVLPLYAEDINEESVEIMVIRWLIDLCDAVGHIHQAGFVHGDITPKNIIVSGGNVVLTDYDSVKEIGSKPEIFTSLYCSQSVQDRISIDASDDIFALAASFFHVLFEREPFLHGTIRNKQGGFNYTDLETSEYERLLTFFDRAVNPDRSLRFKNGYEAKEFLQKLIGIYETELHKKSTSKIFTKNEVPWLKNLLRIYPGSRYGNDETRGLDTDFALQTYVETNLDKKVLEDIKNRKVSLIILSGNAGDGKTAFLQNLAKNLGLPPERSSKRIWDYTMQDGLRIKVNLDGSASYLNKSASELLNEFFEPFINGTPPKDLVHLIAINSGPLQAWLYEQENDSVLVAQLQKAIDGDLRQLHDTYRFIDLNNRSIVGFIDDTKRTISTDFLDNLLNRLIGKKEYWDSCSSCTASNYCHIWEVVSILLEQDKKAETLRQRLYEALQAVHQRGEIHITTRDLKAALSYILFGVYYCTEIHENPDLCKERYYDRAFNPLSSFRQGEVLKELTIFDPALEAHPKIDRYIIGKGLKSENMPPQYPDITLPSARRRIYFEWSDEDFKLILKDDQDIHESYVLAKGRYLKLFRELPFKNKEEITKICYDLCRGISRLEDLPPIAFQCDGVPIKIEQRTVTEESIFWVVKPFERFSLEPVFQSNDNYLERLHTHLELKYKYEDGSYESLIMGYELFYILMEIKNGLQLTDTASEDIFANLSIFTQRLAQEHSRQLFAWNLSDEDTYYSIEIQTVNGIQKLFCNPISKGVGRCL